MSAIATSVSHYLFEAKPLWSGQIGVGGVADAVVTTIPLQAATGLTNGNAYIFRLNRVTSEGKKNLTNLTEVGIGELNGTNLINCLRGVEGTAQPFNAGIVVEILNTATHWNKLIEFLGIEHSANGKHSVSAMISNGTVKDEDNMASDSATAIPTQQSVKAYVDEKVKSYAADAGSTDSYAITLSPAPAAYSDGMKVVFKANTANTGPATLDVNGLGAKTIKKLHDQDLADGDIESGQIVTLVYDGTYFQVQSQTSSAAAVTKATAQEVVAGTDDAKYATPLSLVPLSFQSLFAQSLVNGNFDIWQRGTSLAGGTGGSTTAYSADCWLTYNGSAATTISQQDGTGVPGSRYSLRSQRNSGQTATTTQYLINALETMDSIKLRGQKLTLSFWAKCGANFSAASSILTAKIITGKGTDQNVLAGLTNAANAASENKTLTTSWQKFTVTLANVIASDITQIAVQFEYVPVGTASTNDWFEIAQVQLCAGTVALPFLPRSYDEELDKCLRYLWVPDENGVAADIAQGQAYSTTGASILFVFPRRMRIPPNLTATAGDWKLNDPSTGGYDVTVIAIDGTNTVKTRERANCAVTVASGLTTNRPYLFRSDAGGTRKMIFSAEM